jgi:hypothetical protein
LTELWLLRVRADSVLLLQPPESLFGFTPKPAYWLQIDGSARTAFARTFDFPHENVVGTQVFLVSDDSMTTAYKDPVDVCRAGELTDVDRDGVPEVVAYIEDPTDPARNGCRWLCYEQLYERFSVVPAWVSVNRWSGGRWVRSEERYAAFYRALADRYAAAHRWLATEAPGEHDCQYAAPPEQLRAWAERAHRLGAQ